MADNRTPMQRSYTMSRIRSKDTTPEVAVRKYLFAQGFRYRKNVRKLPGCPDIVLPKYHSVIFVQGCFWHMHDCGSFHWPATNQEFWRQKIFNNIERDKKNKALLIDLGWKYLLVWECELRKNPETTLQRLVDAIKRN